VQLLKLKEENKVCSKCKQAKPFSDYWFRKSRKNTPLAMCKLCSYEQNKGWRERNPDYEKKRYSKIKTQTRERHLVRKYGVNLERYEEMLNSQDGKCAICGDIESNQYHKVFHVDHCHATGNVRGLLCSGCNHTLGHFKDNEFKLKNAIAYLVKHKNPQVAAQLFRAIKEIENELT
jgi:hypothetical protein